MPRHSYETALARVSASTMVLHFVGRDGVFLVAIVISRSRAQAASAASVFYLACFGGRSAGEGGGRALRGGLTSTPAATCGGGGGGGTQRLGVTRAHCARQGSSPLLPVRGSAPWRPRYARREYWEAALSSTGRKAFARVTREADVPRECIQDWGTPSNSSPLGGGKGRWSGNVGVLAVVQV